MCEFLVSISRFRHPESITSCWGALVLLRYIFFSSCALTFLEASQSMADIAPVGGPGIGALTLIRINNYGREMYFIRKESDLLFKKNTKSYLNILKFHYKLFFFSSI